MPGKRISLVPQGFSVVWDGDSLDWKDLSAPEITKRVTSKVQPGSIVLFHNAALHTPEALPGIIEYLLQEGYTFLPISQLLLEGRPEGASGTCVACVMEGTRPVLAEVQALVAKTTFNVPRRAADGFDFNRAVLLMAVAEKRAGLKLSLFDTYINVIGGLRLDEPGADLPVILAVASSYRDQVIDSELVAIGEVGLTGEIRSVSNMNQRLSEVSRLGFKKCIIPRNGSEKLDIPSGLSVYRVRNIREAIETAL